MRNGIRKRAVAAAIVSALWLGAAPAWTGELVHEFVNPSFGGNPFNGPFLLSNAQLQNDHEDGAAGAEDSFADRIDRLVLGQVARALLGNITDPLTGEIIPGTLDTGINTIVIVDLGTSLEVTITNNETGETTVVVLPN